MVEMGAGDMRMAEFKALFRLRKGKFQPGTQLRLISKQPSDGSGRVSWDGEAVSYWVEMEEDVVEIAAKHSVSAEISTRPLYKELLS